MSASVLFLMMAALLFPTGILERVASSVEHTQHDMLCNGGNLQSDTAAEFEVEEPELYVSGCLSFEAGCYVSCRVVLLSRDHVATAELDSSGCRPPPIAA